LAGPVLEIFAKREGWYEYSLYECKVSVIEGEDATSMGIERVKDKKSDAIWAIKRCLGGQVNNQFAGIEMPRMLRVV
jgi:hypothetical protein